MRQPPVPRVWKYAITIPVGFQAGFVMSAFISLSEWLLLVTHVLMRSTTIGHGDNG